MLRGPSLSEIELDLQNVEKRLRSLVADDRFLPAERELETLYFGHWQGTLQSYIRKATFSSEESALQIGEARPCSLGKVKPLDESWKVITLPSLLRAVMNIRGDFEELSYAQHHHFSEKCFRELHSLVHGTTEPAVFKTYLCCLYRTNRRNLHQIKPVAVEQWLRSLESLSNGSKAKIRNIMSALFSHAIRYEIADKNPIKAVRQSAKRRRIPVILSASELSKLLGELGGRERAMIVIEALTGIRRSELMGLKWKDVDFISSRIEITRSVVDQSVGNCKTEASRKPVVIDDHVVHALLVCRQESMYTGPDDWVWASPQRKGKQPLWLSTIMRYYIQPAAKQAGIQKKIGWHTFRHTFSSLVKSLGTDAKVVQD